MHVLRRSGSLKGGRPEEPGSPDRRAQISQPKKRADQGKVEGKEIVKLSSRRSRLAAPEKPPSRELGRRSSSRLAERENRSTTDRAGPSRRNRRPPINPSKTRPSKARYSSSSGSTSRSSDSGSSPGTTSATASHERAASASAASARSGNKHRGEVPRRAVGPSVPRRHPAGPSQAAPTGHRYHASEERRPRRRRPPAAAKADHLEQMKPAADQRGGRLRRLRNKLAIVFHHQHRHHHFHHHHRHPGHADGDSSSEEEEDDDDDCREHRHKRSPWRYLRRILHRASDGEDRGRGRKLQAMEARGERAAEKIVRPAHHQHGHMRALVDALLTHVWGTRWRRRKPVRASRVRLRKLHWWQRWRRRGGVKLGDSKKPPLRLGRK